MAPMPDRTRPSPISALLLWTGIALCVVGLAVHRLWEGELHRVTRFDPVIAAGSGHDSQGGLSAPMNGSVVRILVTPGQTVAAGAALVVLEAMKMEHSLRAPRDGVVKSLFCQEGDMVKEGSVLVALE